MCGIASDLHLIIKVLLLGKKVLSRLLSQAEHMADCYIFSDNSLIKLLN